MWRKYDPVCVITWMVLPWISLLIWIAIIMALSAVVGGTGKLFAIIFCSLSSWWMFSAAGRQRGMVAKVFGIGAGLLLGICALGILGVVDALVR